MSMGPAADAGRTSDIAATGPGVVLFLALLALTPLLGAQFGYGNQIEQFSIVARLQDPTLMQGDLYVDSAAGFGPRIYYARALAWLTGFLPLPAIIHILAVLCSFALGGVSYLAATRLLGVGAIGGLLAAVLAVTNGSFSLGLAGYLRFDSFQPANLAIPLALSGFYLLARLQAFAALVPLVLAALAHPLIGVEIALIAYLAVGLAVLVYPARTGLLRSLTPLVASGVIFAAAMFVAWALPMTGSDGVRMTDEAFFDTLAAFRAPHHYLGFHFPRRSWIFALIFVAGAGVALALHLRRTGLSRGALALVLACVAVLLLCAASLWFVDVAHSRVWVTAQVFRMLMVVKWVGFLAFGGFLAGWIARDWAVGAVLAVCLAVASADAQPYVIVLVLVAAAAVTLGRRWIGGRVWDVLTWVGLAALVVLTGLITDRYGIPEQSLRALVALLAAALILAPRPGAPAGPLIATFCVVAAVAAGWLTREAGPFGWRALKAQYTWADLTGDDFDIARAAGELSGPDALWLVPPDMENFRLLSGRAVVVDFKSIPFDDAAMQEWRQRIDTLYGPFSRIGYGALRDMEKTYAAGIDWAAAARRYGASHAVLLRDTPWDGEVLYENAGYKAVAITLP